MKIIDMIISKLQVEKLSALIASCHKQANFGKEAGMLGIEIIEEHLAYAEDYFNDAISALKYHNSGQALVACKAGLFQIKMAEKIICLSQKSGSSTLNYLVKQDTEKRKKNIYENEAEFRLEFLANSLAEMKVALEYSNCQISLRAQSTLNSAMDFYNDSLLALKDPDASERAINCAKSGLLQLNLAGAFIVAENELALPGWRELTNLDIASPLSNVDKVISEIAQIRQTLHQLADERVSIENVESANIESSTQAPDKERRARKYWENAYNRYTSGISSFAKENIQHARAELKKAERELSLAREILSDSVVSEDLNNENVLKEHLPVSDLVVLVEHVKEALLSSKVDSSTELIRMTDRLVFLYKKAIEEFESGEFKHAENSAAESMGILKNLRHKLFSK